MRFSNFPISTTKETPADAEVVSHQLMLRAGLIKRIAAGIYTWMPLGLKVVRNVERVVREEMENAGAVEVAMPVVQPAELWQESGRWDQYGPELARLKIGMNAISAWGRLTRKSLRNWQSRKSKATSACPLTISKFKRSSGTKFVRVLVSCARASSS